MVERYVGRVEHAASGQGMIEIDDLDATDWMGVPTGGFLINAHAPDVWLVGVILLDGPRAWDYATADLVVTRDADSTTDVRFHGKTPFAPTLDESERVAVQERVEARRQFRSNMRTLVPSDDEPFFTDARLSVLERPQRPSDEVPEYFGHMRERIRSQTSRLALEHQGHQIYIAEGQGEGEIFCAHMGPGGGGAHGGPRPVLAQTGVSFSTSWGSGRTGAEVTGIVHDEVIAVRVDGHHAVMGENAFIAFLDDGPAMDQITLTTVDGEFEVRLGRPPDLDR